MTLIACNIVAVANQIIKRKELMSALAFSALWGKPRSFGSRGDKQHHSINLISHSRLLLAKLAVDARALFSIHDRGALKRYLAQLCITLGQSRVLECFRNQNRLDLDGLFSSVPAERPLSIAPKMCLLRGRCEVSMLKRIPPS